MKLVNALNPLDVVQLPDTLMWNDEMQWAPVVSAYSYTLTGALLIETAVMQKGRKITLEPADAEMGWVQRSTVEKLYEWANVQGRRMTLVLEYPDDVREFTVMFRHSDGALDSKPVKGFPEHEPDSWWTIVLRLIEV